MSCFVCIVLLSGRGLQWFVLPCVRTCLSLLCVSSAYPLLSAVLPVHTLSLLFSISFCVSSRLSPLPMSSPKSKFVSVGYLKGFQEVRLKIDGYATLIPRCRTSKIDPDHSTEQSTKSSTPSDNMHPRTARLSSPAPALRTPFHSTITGSGPTPGFGSGTASASTAPTSSAGNHSTPLRSGSDSGSGSGSRAAPHPAARA